MNDLREPLDLEARRVSAATDALASVRHRADKIRLTRRLTSGAIAVLIGVGGLAIAFFAFRPGGQTRPVDEAPLSLPESSLTGKTVLLYAGSDRTFYRADEIPLQSATALLNGLGMDATFNERPLHASRLPSTANSVLFVKPAALDAARTLKERVFPDGAIVESQEGRYEMRISLGDDFLEAQETPIWVYKVVQQFLFSRLGGDAQAEYYLGEEARDQYRQGEGGLSLQEYARPSVFGQRIVSLTRMGERFVAVVEFPLPNKEVVEERLTLGRGNPWLGQPEYWHILSAERTG